MLYIPQFSKERGPQSIPARLRKASSFFAYVAAGLALVQVPATTAAPYLKNRAPLVQTPFVPLPIGSVTASGWLLNQLQLLRDGATGNSEQLYSELGSNAAWLGASQSAAAANSDWERPTYYVKGLVASAYVQNDSGLKSKAQKWLNWTLGSQQSSGAFGPAWNYTDWWPRMPMIYALKDFYEATNDSRVLPFLTNYFHFQANNLAAHPLTEWAKARAGDNIDVILWLYNRTGEASLLTLANTLKSQAYDWTSIYTNNNFTVDSYTTHNVNVSQAIKMPAVFSLNSNAAADRNAFSAGNRNLLTYDGQVMGMSSGTERLRGTSSIQGVELCAVVERMQCNEEAQMILGDPSIGDQLEAIAFNSLPAAMDKANKIHQYYTLPNQVQSIHGSHGFEQDYANGLTPSAFSGFPCCRFNLHMGWPYYVKNMWAGTNDNGLAAMAYGPSQVTSTLGAVNVTIAENTNYPFESQIRFTVTTPSAAAFPLKLRIPAWAYTASVLVNGTAQTGVQAGTFYTINRTWQNNDAVTLNLPMIIRATSQRNQSVAIERGPLLYSLMMTENWKQTSSGPLNFNEYEVTPSNAWNYGLVLDRNNPGSSISVQTSAMPTNPFVTATTPVRLTATAKQVTWGMAPNGIDAAEVQASPIAVSASNSQVTLIPFGAQNTRVTYFPEVTGSAVLPPFSDNFDDGNANGWTTYGGAWTAANGQYGVNSGPGYTSVAAGTNFSSLTYEADVTPNGGDAGLVFRGSNFATGANALTGYYAGLNTSGSVVLGVMNYTYTQITSTSMTIGNQVSHHMKIVASGTLIQVYVDDLTTPRITVNDGSYAGGAIGLRSYNSQTLFDNVSVKRTFADAFDHGSGNWTPISGAWTVSNSQYGVNSGSGYESIAHDTNFADLTYEGNVSLSGSNCGLIFRAGNFENTTNGLSGYYAGVDTGGSVILGKMTGGSYTQLASAAMSIPANTWLHVKVTASSSALKVYVTDMNTPKISITDGSYTVGSIGLRAYNAAAGFDSINVY